MDDPKLRQALAAIKAREDNYDRLALEWVVCIDDGKKAQDPWESVLELNNNFAIWTGKQALREAIVRGIDPAQLTLEVRSGGKGIVIRFERQLNGLSLVGERLCYCGKPATLDDFDLCDDHSEDA